jgi:signal transduction histidine kinase
VAGRRPLARPTSLLAALFGRIGVLFLVIVLVVGLVAFFTAQRRINEIYDGQLIIGANVLRALMADELGEQRENPSLHELVVDDSPLISAEDRKAFDDYAAWRMFRIWSEGRLVMRSDTGPNIKTPPTRDGFEDVVAGQLKWRVYTLHVPGEPVSVQVGERLGIRAALVRGISLDLALPLLLLVPAGALLIWLSLRDGLRVLRALVEELGRRTARDLSPLPLRAWPTDLGPLVRSINQLLGRIERSFHHERRFVDQAAHQLRTPLAVVKLQAQMIAREQDPQERLETVRQLSGGVDRAALLIDRLLTLARLESELEVRGEGDLGAEAQAALVDLAALAAERGVGLAFEGAPTLVRGDPTLLRLICANLIENAVRHAPIGSEVEIIVAPAPDGAVFRVLDAGKGIAAEDRERVLERFYRGKDVTGGVGLGLSIVAEAVRLVAARLDLRSRSDGRQGLEAWVTFAGPAKV